jgi:hypothetical protein
MKLRYFYYSVAFCGVLFQSCQNDEDIIDHNTPPNELDVQLEEALLNASGGIGKAHYRFPTDLSSIP